MPAGRPPRFTKDRQARFLAAIREGNTKRASAAIAGVSTPTVDRLIAKSENFVLAYARAQAEAEERMVATIVKAATGYTETKIERMTDDRGRETQKITTTRKVDAGAAQFWLERRRRDDWGPKVEVEAGEDLSGWLKDLTSGIVGRMEGSGESRAPQPVLDT